MSNEAALSLTNTILDDYQVGELIRSEVYGPIFRAIHQKTQHKVHLHILTSPDDRSLSADRFRHGVYNAKGVKSPYLCEIDGFGKINDLFYIAYVDDQLTPLADHLIEQSAFEDKEFLHKVSEWIGHLSAGLLALHGQRSFHHILSLNTLWINESDHLKISHHGIAPVFKRRMQSLSSAISLNDPLMLARAPYVSPEEIKGRMMNQSADLYSTAILAYQLLIGTVPFLGSEPESTLRMHLEIDYQHLASEAKAPQTFDLFFAQGLSKDVKGRFISAQAFQATFTQAFKKYTFQTQALVSIPNIDSSQVDSAQADSVEHGQELAFGDDDNDEMAFGFSQSESDERTFLEFGDVDDQTMFEEDLDQVIEEAHYTGVYDAVEDQKSSLPNHLSSSGTVDLVSPIAHASVVQSKQIEDIPEFEDEDHDYDPSRVLPIPMMSTQTPNNRVPSNNFLSTPSPPSIPSNTSSPSPIFSSPPSIATPLAISNTPKPQTTPPPSTAQHLSSKPDRSPKPLIMKASADEWPTEAPNASQLSRTGPHSSELISGHTQSIHTNTRKKRRPTPKLQASRGLWSRVRGVIIGLVLAGIGAAAVAFFNPFEQGSRPEMLVISTSPSNMNLMINRKPIKETTPYQYKYQDDLKEGEEIEVKFIWKSELLKLKVPVFNGQSWLNLKTPILKKGGVGSIKRLIIISNVGQAQVKQGEQIIGNTPFVFFGKNGSQVHFTVSIPGAEKQVKAKLGGANTDVINVSFELPKSSL